MDYDASSIQVLEGLEGPRKNAGMYVGGTDADGVFQIVKEVIDNAIDESLAANAGRIGISVQKPWIYVWDEGRGIPVEVHPDYKKEKLSTLTIVYTKLHAGGKIKGNEKSAYKYSVGLHGLGGSLTNALSSKFEVCTFRRKWHHQAFAEGKPVSGVEKAMPFEHDGLPKRGTIVRFIPDRKIFGKSVMDINRLRAWLDTAAFLYAVKFTLHAGSGVEEFHHPGGLKDFVSERRAALKAEPVHDDICHHQSDEVDIAVQWTTADGPQLQSYVNGSATAADGTHVNGLYRALNKAFDAHKGVRANYTSEDLREGLTGAINVRLASPVFASQVKDRLTSKEASDLVHDAVLPVLQKFLASNKSMTRAIISRANELSKVRQEYKISKTAAAQMKATRAGRSNLPPPSKFAVSMTKDAKKRELFIVEGASAGGSPRKARDKEYQEILGLQGKFANIYKSAANINNPNILDMMKAIGYDPSRKNPMESLRVGKVILMSDSDPDGAHINVLIAAVFNRITPELIARGMLYVVDAPLFKAVHKGRLIYADTVRELRQQIPSKAPITRMKGWGEANPMDMRHFAFDPATRKLIVIDADSTSNTSAFINLMSSEGVSSRKDLLGI